MRVPSTLVYVDTGVGNRDLATASKTISRIPLRGYAESAASSKRLLFCIEERDLTGNGEKHILGFSDFFESKELFPAFDFIFPPELNNIYLSKMVVVSHEPTYVHIVCLSEQGVAISIHISN